MKLSWVLKSISLLLSAALVMGVPAALQAAPRCGDLFAFSGELVSQGKVDGVLTETLEGAGNFSSRYSINQAEALAAGERWLGAGYRQIGKDNSGVFVSADGRRRFRIDNGSLIGNHSPHKPHVHLELVHPFTGVVISNNHIPLNK
ncbi:hypothetical protein [Bdellovibrio bacteriovorus]|uniref:hypothetical protein n=1 Tax=Bdellovibrio bacteriovorus TaxID=959 RepID=UPI003D04B21C